MATCPCCEIPRTGEFVDGRCALCRTHKPGLPCPLICSRCCEPVDAHPVTKRFGSAPGSALMICHLDNIGWVFKEPSRPRFSVVDSTPSWIGGIAWLCAVAIYTCCHVPWLAFAAVRRRLRRGRR